MKTTEPLRRRRTTTTTHAHVFGKIKILNINMCFHLLITSAYVAIKSKSCEEAAILNRHVSALVRNIDQPVWCFHSWYKKDVRSSGTSAHTD